MMGWAREEELRRVSSRVDHVEHGAIPDLERTVRAIQREVNTLKDQVQWLQTDRDTLQTRVDMHEVAQSKE